MQADYIIVGAGSAGCILAHRLTASGAKVLLLEAGPRDWHPMIHVPAGMRSLIANPAVNWNFQTEPEPGLGGRRLHWPRGKVLGGCSAINGMAYVRGNPEDFNHWARQGCAGWSYDEVLPFFKRTERYERGDPRYRGQQGLMQISDYDPPMEVTKTFVRAAQQCGHAFTDDINGERQEGVGFFQMARRGRFRETTATTFLRAARRSRNLVVETGGMATKLLFEGRQCVGVAYTQGALSKVARARREVIVAAGAIGSPHLLQMSGIGDPEHLRQVDITPFHSLKGVGQNLSDHPRAGLTYRLAHYGSVNEMTRGWRLLREITRWTLQARGALTYGVTGASVFCRSRPDIAWPDLQLLFIPVSFDATRVGQLEREPGISVNICPVRPYSRGSVMARSPDPSHAPAISANYYEDARDMDLMLTGLRMSRTIMEAPAFQGQLLKETDPGVEVLNDQDLETYVRSTTNSVYHPVGTCKMGVGDDAVVDPELRVHGLQGLRVVDASVMPCLTTGNTAAPTMMIAEKAAAMILGEERPQAEWSPS